MPVTVSLAAIPRVLDEDELPFVFGIGVDRRRALSTEEVEYRRGEDRCTVEHRYGGEGLRLRALVLAAGSACYVTACVGPLLNDWWPLLQRHPPDPQRPVLSAAAEGHTVTMRNGSTPVSVGLVPPSEAMPMTLAVYGINEALTDETLRLSQLVTLPVIKTALLALSEYRTLVNPVPDISVESSGTVVPLATVLDAAEEAADAIGWQLDRT